MQTSLSSWLIHLKTVSGNLVLPDSLKALVATGVELKTFGKTVIGFEFALDKILHDQPKQPEDIPAWSKDIATQLRSKGVALPQYMGQLLNHMRKRLVGLVCTARRASSPKRGPADP